MPIQTGPKSTVTIPFWAKIFFSREQFFVQGTNVENVSEKYFPLPKIQGFVVDKKLLIYTVQQLSPILFLIPLAVNVLYVA